MLALGIRDLTQEWHHQFDFQPLFKSTSRAPGKLKANVTLGNLVSGQKRRDLQEVTGWKALNHVSTI